jgi:hypothetical protein
MNSANELLKLAAARIVLEKKAIAFALPAMSSALSSLAPAAVTPRPTNEQAFRGAVDTGRNNLQSSLVALTSPLARNLQTGYNNVSNLFRAPVRPVDEDEEDSFDTSGSSGGGLDPESRKMLKFLFGGAGAMSIAKLLGKAGVIPEIGNLPQQTPTRTPQTYAEQPR